MACVCSVMKRAHFRHRNIFSMSLAVKEHSASTAICRKPLSWAWMPGVIIPFVFRIRLPVCNWVFRMPVMTATRTRVCSGRLILCRHETDARNPSILMPQSLMLPAIINRKLCLTCWHWLRMKHSLPCCEQQR